MRTRGGVHGGATKGVLSNIFTAVHQDLLSTGERAGALILCSFVVYF